VHLEERPIQEQVVDPGPGQAAAPPRLELGAQPLADPADCGSADLRASPDNSASMASTSRSDRPRTQQEMTKVSSALVRVTSLPNS
jgi:hypothetical protein